MTAPRKQKASIRSIVILTIVATAAQDRETLDYCAGALDAEIKRKTLETKYQ